MADPVLMPNSGDPGLRDALTRNSDLRTADLRSFDKLRDTDDINLRLEMQRIREEILLRYDFLIRLAHEAEEKGVMRVDALAKELSVAMSANAIAIDKAENAVNERLGGMNEFRQTLTDQAATFATRTAVSVMEGSLTAKMEALFSAAAAERKSLRETLEAKVEAVSLAGMARADAARQQRDAEVKALWKFVYGLATAIAVIETILRLSPPK